MHMRKEERLDIAKARINLWIKFGEGRKKEDIPEDELKAWETLRDGVLELDDDKEDGSCMKIDNLVIRKPTEIHGKGLWGAPKEVAGDSCLAGGVGGGERQRMKE